MSFIICGFNYIFLTKRSLICSVSVYDTILIHSDPGLFKRYVTLIHLCVIHCTKTNCDRYCQRNYDCYSPVKVYPLSEFFESDCVLVMILRGADRTSFYLSVQFLIDRPYFIEFFLTCTTFRDVLVYKSDTVIAQYSFCIRLHQILNYITTYLHLLSPPSVFCGLCGK